MADWMRRFSKNNDSEDIPDFVLYDDAEDDQAEDSPAVENDVVESETSMDETARLDLSAANIETDEDKDNFFTRNKSSFLIGGIAVSGVILIAVVAIILVMLVNPLYGYNQAVVTKGNVIHSINVDGVLEANATYAITSLTSGTVIESIPEEGEFVSEGTILYQLDDSEADLSVKQAKNRLERAKAAGSTSSSTLKIYSTESGTIQSLSITSGSSVSAGQVVATIRRSDDSVVSVTSMVSGKVTSVSVKRGGSVSSGGLIATVSDTQAEMDKKLNTYDQKGYEYDVEVAEKYLENYTIKAPVSGIITQKNAKVGDNVTITSVEHPLMVIVDTNAFKFTFQVEEKDLETVEVGQDAIVSTDSVPGESFSGKVSRVSHKGVRNEEGTLMFDVDVVVENPGELKEGMNVTAKVVLDSATNVLYIPEKALLQADGEKAIVLVKEDANTAATTATPFPATQQTNNKNTAQGRLLSFAEEFKVPKGYRLVMVQYGVKDGTNVEIISGLKLNQTVMYDPDWTEDLLIAAKPSATPTPTTVSTHSSFWGDTTPADENPDAAPSSTAPVISDDEEEQLRKEIMEKIKEAEKKES